MAKKGAGANFEEAGDESLVVDLSQVESGFACMPKGMYPCRVDELTFDYSQSSGNPMWSWVLEVEGGEFAGRKLFFYTVWKGDGMGITKTTLSRVKPELLEGPIDPEAVANEGSLIDLRCRCRVNIRKYEGEDRNNVQGLFAASDDDSFAG